MTEVSLERPEFTTYLKYAELVALIHEWARQHPRWCRLSTIGSSADGRDLYLVTVGDHHSDAYGGVDRRPAIWVDANHHAGEVIGSAVALATIWSLIQRAEAGDASLSETTWYVQPRIAVDGSEVYLTTPHKLRSAAIDYPSATPLPGLHPEDIDGDGHIVQMRIPDAAGEWKVSARDRRLMVRRSEDDAADEQYYRLMSEGMVYGSTETLRVAPTRWGLDFNRSYPHNWQPEYRQAGAGPYPLYPPETRANADAVLARPNICLIVSYHTFGGFAFRLPSSAPLAAYTHTDLRGDYRMMCERFSAITGGPTIQSYDEATSTARFGSLMDWAYNQHGMYGWVPELWDVWKAAGVVREHDENYFGARDEADQATLLAWNDRELAGQGFVEWHIVEHPQLGQVEVGGWTYKFTHQNPPGRYIPGIAVAHIQWTDYLATLLPRIDVSDVSVESVGNDTYRITATITNNSFLPTNISQQAINVRRADPVHVELQVQTGAVLDGARRNIGHLAGRGTGAARIWEDPRPAANTARVSWIVQGTPTGSIVAWSARAGRTGVPLDSPR